MGSSNLADEEIKAHILFKIRWRRHWEGKQTAIESVMKGVPKHLAGRCLHLTKELIREGLVLRKPTHHGPQIFLNIKKREEILGIVEKFGGGTGKKVK